MASTATWSVEIQLFEDDEDTSAKAVLVTGEGPNRHRSLTGTGRSRKNPSDVEVPEIGEEVAAARALRDLAARLLGAASEDIADLEHHEVHLVR